MPGITGMATTYNCPNYVGELFAASPEDTPLLSSIGGLTGGVPVGGTTFSWSGYDLRDAEEGRQRTEGATAPAAEGRARFAASNVVEVRQEKVSVSYTKQGATKQVTPASGSTTVTIGDTVLPADELAFQIGTEMKQIARDVEKTFIVGKYANPTDNQTPRKTRGLIEAITTNVATTTHKAAELTEADILDLVEKVWTNGGLQEGETRTIIVNSKIKRALTRIFIKDAKYQEGTRNVGGVNLKTLETDFGVMNVMLNRYVPADKLIVASLEQLAPAFLEIPGKGHFFAEPLAKTGASDDVQIYGEIGLQYGNEKAHGVLTVAAD